VSEGNSTGEGGVSQARGLAGLIAANVSLIVAIMVYMGWGYENAFYGYFHLNPLSLGISVQDYLFYSLNLFNQKVVFAAVFLIAAVAAARGLPLVVPWLERLGRLLPPDIVKRLSQAKDWLESKDLWHLRVAVAAMGAVITAIALPLYVIAHYVLVNTYLVLALLACGPLLLTWALRENRPGRALYSLAIVVSVICALWAGSLYANGIGTRAAQDFARHLGTKTQVAVYTAQGLSLAGPRVTRQVFPAGLAYRYRYEGLRLLYVNSGTYYLLPLGWTPQSGLTYVLAPGDQMRIELY
jgi:hypothetical protein